MALCIDVFITQSSVSSKFKHACGLVCTCTKKCGNVYTHTNSSKHIKGTTSRSLIVHLERNIEVGTEGQVEIKNSCLQQELF